MIKQTVFISDLRYIVTIKKALPKKKAEKRQSETADNGIQASAAIQHGYGYHGTLTRDAKRCRKRRKVLHELRDLSFLEYNVEVHSHFFVMPERDYYESEYQKNHGWSHDGCDRRRCTGNQQADGGTS